MLLMKLIGFLLGYVSFSASSGFPERFINLCRLNKIPLNNLRCSGSVLTAQTDCNSYKRIRSVAKKSGMKVRITAKHGLYFFLRKHSRRFGLIVGACLCLFCVVFLSTRIWRIEVIGNDRVASEEITSVFASLGVHEGARSASINATATEAAALRKLPEISWININLSGCTAVIEVRETVKRPLSEQDSSPSNLVAARDGLILILRPFNGTAEAAVGSPVLKGDLLISGIEENKDLTADFCKAEGYVVAQTKRSSELSVKQSFKAMKKTDAKASSTLNFLFFDIPLGRRINGGFCEKTSLFIDGKVLPFGISRTVGNTFSEFTCTLSDADALLLASLRFSDARLEEFRGKQINESRIKTSIKNGSVAVSGEFDCIENIGTDSPMQIENSLSEGIASIR